MKPGMTKKRLLVIATAMLIGAKQGHAQPTTPQSAQETVKKSEAQQTAESKLLILLSKYRSAMEAKSTDRLAELVAPELSVLEGSHKNTGWLDYRDQHIGPEMKEWKNFRITDPRISEVNVSGDLGFAVQQATYTIVTEKETLVLDGAETLIARMSDGDWKLLHIHFSGKKRQKPHESK